MFVTVNGVRHAVPAGGEGRRLLDFLREDLDLIGTKNGCDIGVCGTCTVLVDLKPVQACRKSVAEVAGHDVLTIEGLAPRGGPLHPLQQAFIDHGAVQCGFCTPAMVLVGHALLARKPRATREEIRKALNPVLCRCTGYQQIVDAIEDAATRY